MANYCQISIKSGYIRSRYVVSKHVSMFHSSCAVRTLPRSSGNAIHNSHSISSTKSIVLSFFTEQPGFKHKGLKDLVSEMEQRQRARHDLLDAYEASGAVLQGTFGKRLVPLFSI